MDLQSYKTEKLVPIDLPETCAPRKELMDVYQKAAGKRCIYINAPAGCGKTVSTLLWLKKSGCKTIWISLDPYDNALAGFYRIFCTALFSVLPREEILTKAVKDPAFGASPVEHTIDVLSRLSFEDCPYALVLDDFHFITNEEITKSLLYVIKRLPLSFTTLILSRAELPQAFSQYAESGKVAYINAGELAFKRDEIRRHFASFGRFLTVMEAEEAFAFTEGWPIAVNALVMGGNVPTDEPLQHNPLRNYIKAQIWDKLDGELRSFMLQTSVADKFSEELCLRITGNPESRRILHTLLGENMFLSHREGEYRYHHLFLDFLREELAAEPSIHAETLYERAAGYYFDAGDNFNALGFFIKCGCSQGIADALSRFLTLHVEASSDMWSISYINKLPPRVLEENPCLHISCAWCAFFFGEAEELFFHLDRLYERIGEIIAANRAFLKPALLHYVNDPRYTVPEQLARLQALSVHPDIDSANIPKILSHKLPYFLRIYRDFSHYALDMDQSFTEFRAVFSPLFGSHYLLIESGMRSWLLYNQNRIGEALSLVTGEPVTDAPELVFLSKLQVATCLYAAGREGEAARLRKEIAALLKSEKLLHLLPIFSTYETKLKLLNGEKAAAGAWFENYFVDQASQPQFYKAFLHSTTVRAYIFLGEYEKAKELCGKLRKLCDGYNRKLDVAEADVLLAIILWLTGDRQEAAGLLQRTLSEMRPYGYVRVFADEGKAILPVLKRLMKKMDIEGAPLGAPGKAADGAADGTPEKAADGTADDTKKAPETAPYMAERSFLKEVYLAAYEQGKRYKGIACPDDMKPVKLSGQQKRMLELLAQGYKNAEIVELTGLSINTLRYHTKEAYRKLNVTNAADAILRARELGLIRS